MRGNPMLKKSILLSLLLSGSVFAESNTSAKLDQEWDKIPVNTWAQFYSTHAFTVSNNKSQLQSISMCFNLIVCPDSKNYMKIERDCKSYALEAWHTISDRKSIKVGFIYPMRGQCRVIASTETTGGTYSKAIDEKRFYVE